MTTRRRHIDVTHVLPGALEEMATSTAAPSPGLRAAMDRAKKRRAGRSETWGRLIRPQYTPIRR